MEGTEADWWEMLTDYMVDSDIEQHQVAMEPPINRQTYDSQGQSKSLDSTGDATEQLHAVTTEGKPTAPRASGEGLDNLKDLKGWGRDSVTHGRDGREQGPATTPQHW
jgi:hypothetical protein